MGDPAAGVGAGLLWVVGDPIEHSLSPAMHNAGLRALGLPWRYEARRVERGGLAAALEEGRRAGLRGANVTLPLKEEAFGVAVARSAPARRTGAVNTLVWRRDGWWGDNTDVAGFERALDEALPGVAAPGGRALVLGAGGAARTACVVLAGRGVELFVAARRIDRVQRLAAALDMHLHALPWSGAAVLALPALDLAVNATPLGLRDETPSAFPFSEAFLRSLRGLFDMVYRRDRPTTPLVARCRSLDVAAVDGRSMLLYQGVLAFEAFTGRPAPVEAMAAVLDPGDR